MVNEGAGGVLQRSCGCATQELAHCCAGPHYSNWCCRPELPLKCRVSLPEVYFPCCGQRAVGSGTAVQCLQVGDGPRSLTSMSLCGKRHFGLPLYMQHIMEAAHRSNFRTALSTNSPGMALVLHCVALWPGMRRESYLPWCMRLLLFSAGGRQQLKAAGGWFLQQL